MNAGGCAGNHRSGSGMVLVIGGSASGKSAFAEELLSREPGPQIYLASMENESEESRRRIQKHREQRKDRGFQTVEAPRDILSALTACSSPSGERRGGVAASEEAIEPGTGSEDRENPGERRSFDLRNGAVLLECLSNLTANEMFLGDGTVRRAEHCKEILLGEVMSLSSSCRRLFVVGTLISEEQRSLTPLTEAWIRSFSEIQNAIAAEAEAVWRVDAGIPVRLK